MTGFNINFKMFFFVLGGSLSWLQIKVKLDILKENRIYIIVFFIFCLHALRGFRHQKPKRGFEKFKNSSQNSSQHIKVRVII